MKKDIRVLAIIPARGGSKSIPKKNIHDVCGMPLIHYSIKAANESALIDAVIVSTDSPEIAEIAKLCDGEVPFLRPAEFAQDDSRDVEYLRHAVEWVRKERGWHPEIIVMVPPTSPSRTAADLDRAIQHLIDSNADSVRTVVHNPHFNPYKMWRKISGSEDRIEPIFENGYNGLPRQEIGDNYYQPVAIAYVMKVENIDKGELWGEDIRMVPFPLERFTDIDTYDDLHHAEQVLKIYSQA
ncbi:acylneuraminate cytidylyltransferase family protein [Patescibacteria group bacterium]|nr:acylneuraminate cytidylyltransferase family protein [Patescibacteria group bacterium]MBU1755027.1 acylneuraminate cytidylyltransferase family protein [Patescibacteria group bacterium]